MAVLLMFVPETGEELLPVSRQGGLDGVEIHIVVVLESDSRYADYNVACLGVKGHIALRTAGIDDVADGSQRPSIDSDAAEHLQGLSLVESDGQVGQRAEGNDAEFFRVLSDLFSDED